MQGKKSLISMVMCDSIMIVFGFKIRMEELIMACFLVPTAEAIVVTAVNKLSEKREKDAKPEEFEAGEVTGVSFHDKVKWLQNMLWGGSALLAFEHMWHGEIVPWFPFLTAAETPAGLAEMLQEMATAGVTMAALVTAVWGLMLAGAKIIEKRLPVKHKLTR